MKRINIIILILLIASIASCRDDNNPVVSFDKPTPEEITLQNCHIAQEAADAFAEENNGEYAKSLADTSLAGHTLIDLLPGGEYLVNPYTGLKTEPQHPVWPPELGEIQYMPRICLAVTRGYLILTFDYNEKEKLCPIYMLSPFSIEFFDEEMATI